MRAKVKVTAFMLLVSSSAAYAECRYAIDNYNNAVAEIDTRLRRYLNCVAGSNGSDDCSTEFRRLKSAQDDFESAVSEYQSECQ